MSDKLSIYIEKSKTMDNDIEALITASSSIVSQRTGRYSESVNTGRTEYGKGPFVDDWGYQPVYESITLSYRYSQIDDQAVKAFPAKLANFFLKIEAFAADTLGDRVLNDMASYLETYLDVAGQYFTKDYQYEPSNSDMNKSLPPVKFETHFGSDPRVVRGLGKLWNTLDRAYGSASTSPKDKQALVKLGEAFKARVEKGIGGSGYRGICLEGSGSRLQTAVDRKIAHDLATAERADRAKEAEEAAKGARDERDLRNALDKLTPAERALLASRPQVLQPPQPGACPS